MRLSRPPTNYSSILWCPVSVVKSKTTNLIYLISIVVLYFITCTVTSVIITGVDLLSFEWSIATLNNLLDSSPQLIPLLGVISLYFLFMLAVLSRKHRQLIKLDTKLNEKHHSFHDLFEPEGASEDDSGDDTADTSQYLSVDNDNTGIDQSENSSEATIKDLKTQLLHTEQQLKTALSAKSQFFANMSHELRTPMNGILGMTELLIDSGLSERQSRFADSVRRSAESLLAIINDLLDYSKMESGKLFLENAAFNLREVVEDVCDLHADVAQRKGLELICHIDRSMNESVIGDSNRIRQMLSNLVGNAVKFTKTGEIVIRVKEAAKQHSSADYQIDVIDTGVGITPEGQARIFESFTQADSSYSREFGGAGLGLFIAHKLVSMMDGKINLRSRMNEGSHFTIYLNLETTTDEKANANLQGTLRGSRILIVDDNETNRTILYHQLKSWGVIPEAVKSGEKALEALREAKNTSQPYHIAILDLHMPVMDGIELSRAIESDSTISDTQRVMLTSAALEISPEELRELGISQYISKPARQSQLYNVLANLIQNTDFPEEYRNDAEERTAYRKMEAHVLLAEDNLINQDVALNMLENFGCTVKVAGNGRSAVEAASDEKFDVILMDCQMPVMDGLTATRRLRVSDGPNRDTPVVALTANVMEGDKEKCLESGMNGYLSKPVKQDELYKQVNQWMETVAVVDERLLDNFSEAIEEPDPEQETEELQDGLIVNENALENIKKLQRPGKPDLVAKVIDAYLEKSPAILKDLREGFSDKDAIKVKEAAHSLKSSSAYVGADFMSESCKKIEMAAKNDSLADIVGLVENISTDFDLVVKSLTEYKQRAA